MTEYNVSIPITGVICVVVEAESEEDAIERAMASDDLNLDNLEEWEAHRQITRGNVLYASQNEAEATPA